MIALLLLAAGVIFYLSLRTSQLDSRIDQLTRARDGALQLATERHESLFEAKKKADEYQARLAALAEEHEVLKEVVERSRQVLVSRPKPARLADCVVELERFQQHIRILDESLRLSEERLALAQEESRALRVALEQSEGESAALRRVVDYDTERFRLLQKQKRRQKIKAGFLVIGSLAVAGTAGYAIGVTR